MSHYVYRRIQIYVTHGVYNDFPLCLFIATFFKFSIFSKLKFSFIVFIHLLLGRSSSCSLPPSKTIFTALCFCDLHTCASYLDLCFLMIILIFGSLYTSICISSLVILFQSSSQLEQQHVVCIIPTKIDNGLTRFR